MLEPTVSKVKRGVVDVNFNSFIALCEKICSVPKSPGSCNEKKRLLTTFFHDLRSAIAKETSRGPGLSNEANGSQAETVSIYSAVRLLLCQIDLERKSYLMQESRLAKCLIKAMAIVPHSVDAQALQDAAKSNNDFASVVFKLVHNRCNTSPITSGAVTISQLNDWLDELADAKSDQARDVIMVDVLRRMSPIQIKWFIRIILKDLKLGIGEDTIVTCIAGEDGLRLLNHNYSLLMLCSFFGSEGEPNSSLLKWGFPFRPMLSERINEDLMKDLFESGDNCELCVQDKLDGERVQVHYEDSDSSDASHVKYFSRSGIEYSTVYESVSASIRTAFKGCQQCILDGEMMVIDRISYEFVEKGLSPVDVKTLGSDNPRFEPAFCIFDVVQWEGRVITDIPFVDRYRIIEKSIIPMLSLHCIRNVRVVACWQEDVRSAGEAIDSVYVAVKQKGQEGVILKKKQSTYVPNGRKGCGWYKIKRDYLDQTAEDIDLLIVGYHSAPNASRNSIDSFSQYSYLVACPLAANDLSNWRICGRVSLGFKKSDTARLTDIQDLKTEYMKSSPDYIVNYKGCEGHYVQGPEHGLVVQLRAAEIYSRNVASNSAMADIALRFARAVRLRDDKQWDECSAESDLLEMSKKRTSSASLATKVLSRKRKSRSDQKDERDDELKAKCEVFRSYEACVTGISDQSLLRTCRQKLLSLHDHISFVNYPSLTTTSIILVDNVNSARVKAFKTQGVKTTDAQGWLSTFDA